MGRHPRPETERYEISHMWENHHEIIRMALLGMKNIDIAAKLGCTPETVSITLNSRIVKDKLAIMRAQRDASTVDVAKAIKDLAPKAVEMVERLLTEESTKDAVRLAAAKDVLDRAGHAAPKVIETKNLHGFFTKEDLEDIKRRAYNTAKEIEILADE